MTNVFGVSIWSLALVVTTVTWNQPSYAKDAATSGSPKPILRVLLFDYVKMPSEVRDSFLAQAEEGLNRSGIRSYWLDCTTRPAADTPAGCLVIDTDSDLLIRVLPRKMIGRESALGLAVADRNGGTYGCIFYPAVERIAKGAALSLSTLLAFAALHEVGHLLLGSDAHWPWGIMKSDWDLQTIEEMVSQNRLFLGKQSKLLRARVTARSRGVHKP